MDNFAVTSIPKQDFGIKQVNPDRYFIHAMGVYDSKATTPNIKNVINIFNGLKKEHRRITSKVVGGTKNNFRSPEGKFLK